jgi:hypothetical protein
LYPSCKAVFLFDNSCNHGVFADDALVANRMTLNEKPWLITEKYQFKDTTVIFIQWEVLNQSFFMIRP